MHALIASLIADDYKRELNIFELVALCLQIKTNVC